MVLNYGFIISIIYLDRVTPNLVRGSLLKVLSLRVGAFPINVCSCSPLLLIGMITTFWKVRLVIFPLLCRWSDPITGRTLPLQHVCPKVAHRDFTVVSVVVSIIAVIWTWSTNNPFLHTTWSSNTLEGVKKKYIFIQIQGDLCEIT